MLTNTVNLTNTDNAMACKMIAAKLWNFDEALDPAFGGVTVVVTVEGVVSFVEPGFTNSRIVIELLKNHISLSSIKSLYIDDNSSDIV